jgi:tRNA A37 threonylcarbamoyladenosine synthetase subunit TsaC/SUA5/YrdC
MPRRMPCSRNWASRCFPRRWSSLERELDLIVDCGACGTEPTTVIDLTGEEPVVVRKGRGSLEVFGLAATL